ncbi:MAG: EamA family transporter [Pseudomonadota bacterium]|nr:EamA family transporter [Pseudomonadota bacterium]
MKPAHLIILAVVPLVIAVGQILFKLVSTGQAEVRSVSGSLVYIADWRLWLALILYGSATFAWLAAIRKIPINQAYMFMALSYVYLPVISWAVLGERFSLAQAAGLALILAGLYFSMSPRGA